MYCVSGSLTILEASTSSSEQRLPAPRVRVARAVLERLRRHLGQRRLADAVLGHVALDLHREELRGEHEAGLAVPGAEAPVLRQRVERARRVLVEADDERDLRRAGRQHRVRRGKRRPAGRAAVLDVDERHAGEAEHRHGRVGVARGVGAAGRELDVLPADAGVARARRVPRPPPSRGRTRPRAARTGGCRCRRPRRSRQSSTGANANVTRAVAAGRGDQHQLHRHADAQALRVGLGEPRLDAHLARAARRSRRRRARTSSGVAGVRRGLRREALDRPGPQRPAAAEPALRDVARRAARRTSPGAGT